LSRKIDFELEGMFPDEMEPLPPWKMSFSLEALDQSYEDLGNQDMLEYGLKRSESAKLDLDRCRDTVHVL
jgi:hypothetical protein